MNFLGAIKVFFLSIGLLLFAGTGFQLGLSFLRQNETAVKHPRENYVPALTRLNSMAKLEHYVDSLAAANGYSRNDNKERFVELADSVLGLRFYYGLQNYKFSENFLANLTGKYLWSHFGAKVDPEHILDGQKAFCSQSSIVFQELMKRKGIDVRTVRLANHFCTEVMINGHWGFFDVSYKPNFSDTPRLSTEQLTRHPQYLQQAYLFSFKEDFSENVIANFDPEKITYGRMNAFPAWHMLIFHRITWFFSWFGWGVFFALAWAAARVARVRKG